MCTSIVPQRPKKHGRGGETGEVYYGCIPSFAGSSSLFSSSIIVDVAPVGMDPVTMAPVTVVLVSVDPVTVVSVGVDPVTMAPVTVVSVGVDPMSVVSVDVATAAELIYKTSLITPTQYSFPLSLPSPFSSLLSPSLSAPSPYSIVWSCCRY